jgi:hypothetical protein
MLEFIETTEFTEQWRKLGLDDDDLLEVEKQLLRNPEKGRLIRGTGGLRKMRVKINKDKGKSGGGRILYINFAFYERVYLLTVYSKKEKENILPEEKRLFKQIISQIEIEMRDKK